MKHNIYEIKTHADDPREVAEYWKGDGICAVGHRWSYKEEYAVESPTGQWGLFANISKGDIILAYARPNMIAYAGEVADKELRDERKNKTGRLYDYWNQRRVKWWKEPSHFHRKDLPPWIHTQLGKRGTTIRRLNLKGHTFQEAKSVIKTRARSGSALASLDEEMVKAGLRDYFLSNAQVFERGLKIRRIEKEVARGYRPDFIGEDRTARAVIVECKGFASTESCEQLAGYAKKYRKTHKGKRRPKLFLVAFAFDRPCRKAARKAGIKLFECKLILQEA